MRFAEGVVDPENPLYDRFKWDHIDARLVWTVEPPVVRAYGALYIESSAGTDCWQRTLNLPSKDNAHFLHIPRVRATLASPPPYSPACTPSMHVRGPHPFWSACNIPRNISWHLSFTPGGWCGAASDGAEGSGFERPDGVVRCLFVTPGGERACFWVS